MLAVLILTIRLVQRAIAHSRHMGAMGLSGEAQKFWAINKYSAWWKFKKHMLYAPLKNKRHNREIRLSQSWKSRHDSLSIPYYSHHHVHFGKHHLLRLP